MRIKAIGGNDPSDQTKTIITRMFAQVKDQNGDWNREQSIPLDFPSFYKNYADLSSLASALGAFKKIVPISNIPDDGIKTAIEASRVNAQPNSLFSGKSSAGQHEGGWYGYKALTPSDGDYGAMIIFLGAYSDNFDVLIGKYETYGSAWRFYKIFV